MTGMLAGVAAVLCDVVYTMARSVLRPGEVGAAGGADGPLLPGGGGGGWNPSWSSSSAAGWGRSSSWPPAEGGREAAAVIYLELLWSFCPDRPVQHRRGYAAMPLIQHQVVDLHPWLTMTQFADVIAIAEMTPALSPSTPPPLWGFRWRASPGPWWPRQGSVLPSCVIVLLLAFLYYKFKGFSVIQGSWRGCGRRWWP